MLFYLKRTFADLNPSIFRPLYKMFIRPHLEYAIPATHPVLSRAAKALENVQKLGLKFVKGLRYVPYEVALQQLRLFSLTEDDNWQGCVGTKCLFTNFQADNYGSSSGGGRKKWHVKLGR